MNHDPAGAGAGASSQRFADRRDDGVAGLCGVWMVIGLFLDGWAHRNQKPETFFSPWHGILYSGFVASAVWMLYVARRYERPGTPLWKTMPVGYGLRTVGVLVFGAGAVADFAWHQIFGIEVDVEALLSPSHLLLLSGGILMALGPIASVVARERVSEERTRARWSDTGAAVAAVAFVLSVVQFFLMYVSPYDRGIYDRRWQRAALFTGGDWLVDEGRTRGIAAILVFTFTTVVALLWVVRNVELPKGSFVALLFVPAFLQTILTSFDTAARLLGPAAAAVFAEVSWRRVRMVRGGRNAGPVLAAWVAGVVALTWFGLFLGVQLQGGLVWQVEFWSGTTTLAALLSAVVTIATEPPSHQVRSSCPN